MTYRELPLGRPQLRVALVMRSHLLHILLDEELAAGSCHLDGNLSDVLEKAVGERLYVEGWCGRPAKLS